MELPNPATVQLLELLEPLEPPAPTNQGPTAQLLQQDFPDPMPQAQDFLAQGHLEMPPQQLTVLLEPLQESLELLEPMALLEPPPEPLVLMVLLEPPPALPEPTVPLELPLEQLEPTVLLDHHPFLLRTSRAA